MRSLRKCRAGRAPAARIRAPWTATPSVPHFVQRTYLLDARQRRLAALVQAVDGSARLRLLQRLASEDAERHRDRAGARRRFDGESAERARDLRGQQGIVIGLATDEA